MKLFKKLLVRPLRKMSYLFQELSYLFGDKADKLGAQVFPLCCICKWRPGEVVFDGDHICDFCDQAIKNVVPTLE